MTKRMPPDRVLQITRTVEKLKRNGSERSLLEAALLEESIDAVKAERELLVEANELITTAKDQLAHQVFSDRLREFLARSRVPT